MELFSRQAPVSVIVPCYRCRSSLERAVASVAAQTHKPAELILVDDGSDDGTWDLILQVVSLYAPGWIRTVRLGQNMGAASARNAGWHIATHPYIAFLDSDDAWHPEKIRLQLSFMQSHPNVVLCGHGHKILSNQALPDWDVCEAVRRSQRVGKWSLLLSNRFVTPSAMLKRDIPHRFEERQRYMEDHLLWLRIVCSGAAVENLSDPLVAIYKRSFGQSGLSGQLWKMELGDLGNYRHLLVQNYISRLQFLALTGYSWVKYLRRLVLQGIYTMTQK